MFSHGKLEVNNLIFCPECLHGCDVMGCKYLLCFLMVILTLVTFKVLSAKFLHSLVTDIIGGKEWALTRKLWSCFFILLPINLSSTNGYCLLQWLLGSFPNGDVLSLLHRKKQFHMKFWYGFSRRKSILIMFESASLYLSMCDIAILKRYINHLHLWFYFWWKNCTNICIYVYMFLSMHTYAWVCIYVCICVYKHVCFCNWESRKIRLIIFQIFHRYSFPASK